MIWGFRRDVRETRALVGYSSKLSISHFSPNCVGMRVSIMAYEFVCRFQVPSESNCEKWLASSCVCPHVTARFPPGEFSWNFMVGTFYWNLPTQSQFGWNRRKAASASRQTYLHLWYLAVICLCQWDSLCSLWSTSWHRRSKLTIWT
jgi:hypothetical protein